MLVQNNQISYLIETLSQVNLKSQLRNLIQLLELATEKNLIIYLILNYNELLQVIWPNKWDVYNISACSMDMVLGNRAQTLEFCMSVYIGCPGLIHVSFYSSFSELTQIFMSCTFTHVVFICYECNCKPKFEKFGNWRIKIKEVTLTVQILRTMNVPISAHRDCRRCMYSRPGFSRLLQFVNEHSKAHQSHTVICYKMYLFSTFPGSLKHSFFHLVFFLPL